MPTSDSEPLHALAFLYLTFGHATDGSINADEMRSLADKLRQWAPEAELQQIGEVLKQTVADYKALGSRQEKLDRAHQVTALLQGHATPEALQKILGDLHHIANADGVISDAEREFMQKTAQILGVPSPV